MLELQVKLGNKNICSLEKTFTGKWKKALEKKGYFFDKISDGSIGYKRVDCYISTNVGFYVCEVKMISGNIFKMNQLRDNQRTALDINEDTKSCSKGIVVVYSKKLDKYTVIPWDKIRHLGMNDEVNLTFKDSI